MYQNVTQKKMTKDEQDEKEIQERKEYFDREVWPLIKKDLKDMTKKDSCFFCFNAGSMMIQQSIEEEIESSREELGKLSGDELKRIMGGRI